MVAKTSLSAPLYDSAQRTVGHVMVSLLPQSTSDGQPSPLVWAEGGDDRALARVQLLEGYEYRYEVRLDADETGGGDGAQPEVTIDRGEVFSPDSANGRRGRLRPGLYVGTIRASVSRGGHPIGSFAVEVRSRKLDYLSKYRWMLRDLTEVFAEVLMQRFAPAEQRFASDGTRDAATLYQRFAFLQQLLTGERFIAAVTRIVTDPHRKWVTEEELRSPSQGFPATSRSLRQITAPGPRLALPAPTGRLTHVPRQIVVERTEETVDTAENRFVKYAFGEWTALLLSLRESILRADRGITQQRGLAEIDALLATLGQWLAADVFREVGRLTYFPASSQVLQRREGYREILQAYLQVETAAKLSWAGGDDVYGAGQRDIATLYEYWVYLQLAAIISRCCSAPLDARRLFDVTESGLSVGLKRGQQRVLEGSVECLGRKLRLEFWYNRTFAAGKGDGSSWTVQMRPDYSLLITAESAPDAVWIHFDAKYRIDDITSVFGQPTDIVGTEDEVVAAASVIEVTGRAKRDDLLKMHAYRDAIRRSAGAYVIYPGTEDRKMPQYHELLPGLGAFPLRPTEAGDAIGTESLVAFIRDVIKHVATQASQHERSRYWQRKIHATVGERPTSQAALFLNKPPADTVVLLGFVKNDAHYDWIRRTGRYNMRADDSRSGRVAIGARELTAEYVVLYRDSDSPAEVWAVAGNPEIVRREWLDDTAYPSPGGSQYWCLPLAADGLEPLQRLDAGTVRIVHDRIPGLVHGQPIALTWDELQRAIAEA